MATTEIQHAVESRMNSMYSGLPIQYDGMKGPVIGGVVVVPPPASGFVFVEIMDGVANPATLGGLPKLRRQTGTIFVTVNVPIGYGTTAARTECDDIMAIFRDAVFSDGGTTVYCREPYPNRLGEKYNRIMGDSTTWFMMQVVVPFYADSFV